MKKNSAIILTLLFMLIYLASSVMTFVKTPRYDIEQEQKAREYVQHAQTIKIIDQKGKRNENYYQVVIHDQTVYFSYIESTP